MSPRKDFTIDGLLIIFYTRLPVLVNWMIYQIQHRPKSLFVGYLDELNLDQSLLVFLFAKQLITDVFTCTTFILVVKHKVLAPL